MRKAPFLALALAGCATSPAVSTAMLPALSVMKSASDVRFTNDGPEAVVTVPPCGIDRPIQAGETVRVWIEGDDLYRCALVPQ